MRIDASCEEQTPAGDFLGRLYYHSNALDLFMGDERRGFPNDGGRHSLILNTKPADVEAFLDLIEESYGPNKGCRDFIAHVRSKMH